MTFEQELIEWGACEGAIDWVEDRTLQQAWNECPRGDWMLWLLEKMEGKEGWLDEKKITLLSCWCLRRAMEHVLEEKTNSLKTIEAREKWARGEITREEMFAMGAIPWGAATDIAWFAARDAKCDTVFNKELLIQADYIRTQFTPPV